MTNASDGGVPPTVDPGDWPSRPERRYAELQAGLAGHHGLDVASRTVATDPDGRVHYLEAGDADGEPVLLLHGITEPAAAWLSLAPALADGYRLLAPDMPGEGLSAKPDYRGRALRSVLVGYLSQLLDGLDVDRPHVVAHSLGGLQGFLLAIDHDRVDRLCLVGAPVGVSRDFPVLPRLFTIRGVNHLLFRAMTLVDPVEYARNWVRRFGVVDDSAVPEVFYDLYGARLALPGLNASLRSLMTAAGSLGRMSPLTDIRAEIAGIQQPTAFVWGDADYYWPPPVGRRLAERMPAAEFHELAGHGHAPWMEPGEAAARRVRSFLDAGR